MEGQLRSFTLGCPALGLLINDFQHTARFLRRATCGVSVNSTVVWEGVLYSQELGVRSGERGARRAEGG